MLPQLRRVDANALYLGKGHAVECTESPHAYSITHTQAEPLKACRGWKSVLLKEALAVPSWGRVVQWVLPVSISILSSRFPK